MRPTPTIIHYRRRLAESASRKQKMTLWFFFDAPEERIQQYFLISVTSPLNPDA
jgi:hypothetical protein